MKTLVLAIFFLLEGTLVLSQTYLSLQKPMRYKNKLYQEGDFLRLQIKSNKKFLAGNILWFNDSLIMLDGIKTPIELRDIFAVIRGPERGGLVIAAPKTLLVASGVFLLADIFNSRFRPTPTTFYISAGIAATSLLFKPFKYRRHSFGRGWRLYYLDKTNIKTD